MMSDIFIMNDSRAGADAEDVITKHAVANGASRGIDLVSDFTSTSVSRTRVDVYTGQPLPASKPPKRYASLLDVARDYAILTSTFGATITPPFIPLFLLEDALGDFCFTSNRKLADIYYQVRNIERSFSWPAIKLADMRSEYIRAGVSVFTPMVAFANKVYLKYHPMGPQTNVSVLPVAVLPLWRPLALPKTDNSNRYPHKCPKCGKPAYIGFNSVECSNEDHDL